jgi:hypothetical protein
VYVSLSISVCTSQLTLPLSPLTSFLTLYFYFSNSLSIPFSLSLSLSPSPHPLA